MRSAFKRKSSLNRFLENALLALLQGLAQPALNGVGPDTPTETLCSGLCTRPMRRLFFSVAAEKNLLVIGFKSMSRTQRVDCSMWPGKRAWAFFSPSLGCVQYLSVMIAAQCMLQQRR